MENCISCIKDGNTGECRNIKDKHARELIEGLKTTISVLQDAINAMTGGDVGSLATDEDIENLQTQITELSEDFAHDIETLNTTISDLSILCATDQDIITLQNQINDMGTNMSAEVRELQNQINEIYPVGSVYLAMNDISPASIFGGVWEKIKDKFLLASGDSYTLGATGGEATHTLTVAEMPEHNHSLDYRSYNTKEGEFGAYGRSWDGTGGYLTTHNKGGSQPHNNMPPYIVVNMWQRIS